MLIHGQKIIVVKLGMWTLWVRGFYDQVGVVSECVQRWDMADGVPEAGGYHTECPTTDSQAGRWEGEQNSHPRTVGSGMGCRVGGQTDRHRGARARGIYR